MPPAPFADRPEELVPPPAARRTLLAVCPNSAAVVQAALAAAHRAGAPLFFAATLNQVDRDGGYTGWTPAALAHFVAEEAARQGYAGPVVLGLDHGGPWKKDAHVTGGLGFAATMAEVRASIEACLAAGYGLLHLDATADRRLPPGALVPVEEMVGRTVALMRHAEAYRQAHGRASVLYEVGTEEVGGGPAAEARFEAFLAALVAGCARHGLPRPTFAVGDVGTTLASDGFDPDRARRLVAVAARFGARLKVHYTDDVAAPEGYPPAGIGGANVGPGLAAVEYDALLDLAALEPRTGHEAGLPEALRTAVVAGGRWRKWLRPGEPDDFDALPPDRQAWLVRTGSRYVWTQPTVVAARQRLYARVAPHRDAEAYVRRRLEAAIVRYLRAFNLVAQGA